MELFEKANDAAAENRSAEVGEQHSGRRSSPSISILVATHKRYEMPKDSVYLPVQAGAALTDSSLGYVSDSTGDNISLRNGRYSELTVLYWGWKNLDADYIGLVHYRRHFKGSGEMGVMTHSEAKELLNNVPVILPKLRRYYIETLWSHYSNTFDVSHLELLRTVIKDHTPEYVESFDKHMARRSGHMFNMGVLKSDLLNEYCEWAFPILEYTESEIDFEGMTPFQKRCMGRLSEYLLDTWILKNNINYVERSVINMEPTNWLKKGSSFLGAKFLGRRYGSSF